MTALPPGMTAIPRGKIAAIATVLERDLAAGVPEAPEPPVNGARFALIETPDAEAYLALWRRIGEAHLWYGRLHQSPADLAAYLAAPTTSVFALSIDGRLEGIADLDRSNPDRVELVYFGVTPDHVGTGLARFMMAKVAAFAAASGARTLWLHTNTLDHPRALAFYRRNGFVPVRQLFELADDPRLAGLYPQNAAPRIPLFGA